ncbi:hypothetical protein RAS1_30400 [Phycisphaerae bacterium RAS1]|nr:hypothetical protein RAS1_30400 [Phycisphaerae bacterium RAS1]
MLRTGKLRPSRWLTRASAAACCLALTAGSARPAGAAAPREGERIVSTPYVVFGYNDLGMHCMNAHFSEIMVLPPFNTLHAQVIRRGTDLNTLIVPASGWTLDAAWAINDVGQIVGTGQKKGFPRAYLLLPISPGDMNCDGAVNVLDINPFVPALIDPAGYAAQYPTCALLNGDVNGDGDVNVLDINPLVALLAGG